MTDRGRIGQDHWQRVVEGLSGQGGPRTSCDYYPCHHPGQDCTLCFCPFYPCLDDRLGRYVEGRTGAPVWSCQDCWWAHRPNVAAEARGQLDTAVRPTPQRLAEVKAAIGTVHPPQASTLMVLGTTSGAGKTLLAAALCRILSDLGRRVAPFKSQNMSLNSTVTASGEEISRAQALQALAARAEPEARMNPVLLKPKRDDVSQVIVLGRPYRDMDVPTYYGEFAVGEGPAIVTESLRDLRRRFDVVVIEGAGSPAEINIADVDLANMRTAEIADAPCLLVVNIEWGGAFAYAYGTLMLLPPEQRARFKGIIINNLYGDAADLGDGIGELERLTGVPVLGVVPHVDHALPDEDSQDLAGRDRGGTRIGVVRLPHISNFTDFDALELEPGVSVVYVEDPAGLARVDAVILPGTKNTVADLRWLHEKGLADAIRRRRGEVPVLGVCGGYQMLGREISDPLGLEGDEGRSWEGLGLLRTVTRFDAYEKRTVQVEGTLASGEGEVRGYEIHMGMTAGEEAPLFRLRTDDGWREEGALDRSGTVMGTYVHGLFDLPPFRRRFLSLTKGTERPEVETDYAGAVEENIARLARVVREHLDLEALLDIVEGRR